MFSQGFSNGSPYSCVRNFNSLNGRRKQEVVIGDTADARAANFLYRTSVKHNWPSQWHTKHKEGYIEFANGIIFDLGSQTVEGNRVYIFCFNREIEILYRKQVAKSKILDYVRTADPERLKTCAGLIVHLSGPTNKLQVCFIGPNEIAALLDTLSLRELESLPAELALLSSEDVFTQFREAAGRPGENSPLRRM